MAAVAELPRHARVSFRTRPPIQWPPQLTPPHPPPSLLFQHEARSRILSSLVYGYCNAHDVDAETVQALTPADVIPVVAQTAALGLLRMSLKHGAQDDGKRSLQARCVRTCGDSFSEVFGEDQAYKAPDIPPQVSLEILESALGLIPSLKSEMSAAHHMAKDLQSELDVAQARASDLQIQKNAAEDNLAIANSALATTESELTKVRAAVQSAVKRYPYQLRSVFYDV